VSAYSQASSLSFSRSFRKLRRLEIIRTPGDAWLLVRAASVASIVPLLMRLRLDRLQALLEPGRHPRAIDAAAEQHTLALVNLALDAVRPLLRPNCLHRGLARYFFLRRAGAHVSLAFGMGQGSIAFGHCWLVRDGEPFLEPRDPRPVFTELYRISPTCTHTTC
jgi:transglutaminase superfamily protein